MIDFDDAHADLRVRKAGWPPRNAREMRRMLREGWHMLHYAARRPAMCRLPVGPGAICGLMVTAFEMMGSVAMERKGKTMTQIARRQFWTAVHRYSGLAMLVFLAIVGATGCLLCFEKPLDAWLNPQLFAPSGTALADPVQSVIALERAHPELAATYFPVRAQAGCNITVLVEAAPGKPPLGYDQVFLDRATGAIAGVRDTRPGWDRTHLMRGVYLFHYTLLAEDWGRWLMGVVAFVWLLSNIVGIYLTWPLRKPWLKNWRKVWTFRWSSPLPRLLLDLHRSSGLWLILPLTVLAFTSVAMNFFGEALIPAVHALSPPRPSPFDGPPLATPLPHRIGFEQALAEGNALAHRRGLGWHAVTLQFEPGRDLVGVRFSNGSFENYRALGPVTYWFDGQSGRFVYEDSPYADSAGLKLMRALYPLHTGEMIGAPGIALDLVLGLTTLGMSVTGLYLWLKRRRPRVLARRAKKRRRREAASA
jgi:uncharacterized iron-regulated membrane protein